MLLRCLPNLCLVFAMCRNKRDDELKAPTSAALGLNGSPSQLGTTLAGLLQPRSLNPIFLLICETQHETYLSTFSSTP